MKKCLVIMHGLPRPSLQKIKENYLTLINNNLGLSEPIEFTSLLSTWSSKENWENKIYELDKKYIKNNFDYSLIEEQPNIENLLENFNPVEAHLEYNKRHIFGAFGTYHFYKKMISIADLYQDFDYYVYCRTDLTIELEVEEEITFNLPKCLWIKRGEDFSYYNDHFFISTKENFLKIFDISIAEVSQLSRQSYNPEQLLKKIINKSYDNVKILNKIKTYKICRCENNSWYESTIEYIKQQ